MNSESTSSRPVIVGLGEVLWDVFPDGPRFGGAPANFACSAAGLSHDVDAFIVSRVGNDELGQKAMSEFVQRGVNTLALQTDSKPTGVVKVTVDDAGTASYDFADDSAWENLQWTNELNELASRTNAVCFGSLGQRTVASREAILQFVAATRHDCLRIYDINLRPPFYSDDIIADSLGLANVLKMNDDELPIVAGVCGTDSTTQEIETQLSLIAQRWKLNTIVLTRGADGATLFHEGNICHGEAIASDVVDTVGAGDSFTAAVALGLLAGRPIDQVCQHACKVAAFVCSQAGATPQFPDELIT